ncbi:MAG: Ig-like domain-containing protein, partial [Prevotella sp.]|nr:Ig-like domain-containing protein [Prevotella sp.]
AYENEEGKAWAMSTTQNANNRAANPVEIEDDGTIIPGSSIQQITVEEEYYFNVGDGYLFAAGTTGNWLRTETEPDDNALATISIADNGDATIVFQGANTRNHMRFNTNNGNPMFSCYADNSSVKTLPRIYRKITGDTPVLADAELAYGVEEFTATIGEDNEFPVLSNPNELPVTYTSSDENVATIDEDGNITLVAAGETTITATSDETSEFEAGEASYLLVVEGEVTPIEYGKYQLVTDASTLAAGDEILIAYVNVGEEATVAQAIGSEQAANNRPAVDVTYNDDETLTPDATAQIITLEGDAEGWNFNVGNGYLYAASTTKNWLRTETEADENAKATITIDEIGDATIVFQGENTHNTLRFNPNNGSPIFSCYGSTSTTGSLPRIYRKVAEVEGETIPVTISSAEWATLYYSDKAFEIPEGVTAKIATAIDEKDEIKLEDLNGIIPAGTAVVLNGPQGTYDFKVVNDETVAPANNLLRGFDASHLTEGGDIYYKLTVKNDIVGFYWGEENGEAFESGEHKAYLAIPAGASNAKFFVLGTAGDLVSEDGGFVDGINEVTASDSKNEYFSLNGTRVNSLRKGIYIVGGKKVVIK